MCTSGASHFHRKSGCVTWKRGPHAERRPPDPSPSISIHLGGSALRSHVITAPDWRPVADGEPPLFHPCVEYKLHVTESTTVPVEQVSFYFWNDDNNKKPFVDVLNQTLEHCTLYSHCKVANYPVNH